MSETKKNLPVTQDEVKKLPMISDQDRDQYLRLQLYTKNLNKAPNEKKVKKKSVGYNKEAKYLPIGEIETMLDQDFFGLWSTTDFTAKVVANEICGEIVLKVFHPVAQVWIERTGAGAVQIQMSAQYEKDELGRDLLDDKKQKIKIKTDITEIKNKIQNTLEKDYPHLKTQCIRNAAQSLGNKYGRNLNRQDVSEYTPPMKDVVETHNDLRS